MKKTIAKICLLVNPLVNDFARKTEAQGREGVKGTDIPTQSLRTRGRGE
jgi:hypothetical protein